MDTVGKGRETRTGVKIRKGSTPGKTGLSNEDP